MHFSSTSSSSFTKNSLKTYLSACVPTFPSPSLSAAYLPQQLNRIFPLLQSFVQNKKLFLEIQLKIVSLFGSYQLYQLFCRENEEKFVGMVYKISFYCALESPAIPHFFFVTSMTQIVTNWMFCIKIKL